MEAMPDVCSVNTKWQGLDNDSLLSEFLTLKQAGSLPNKFYWKENVNNS